MASNLDLFRDFDRVINQASRGQSAFGMPMDLHREGDRFVAEIDLPGVDPSSIDIDVEDFTLTIRAERKSAHNFDKNQWVTRERSYGTFARQLSLGRGLDLNRIEADYADGVLTLSIPVAEDSKPRKVQVRHAAASEAVTVDEATA
ncbi:Hsp20/alpha crystallin family protein [uncultured Agrococcus sp.]|uniref:Hsp20/alpha crystallin family protein n=1 Tax=uncultured Agrococcus sp. TaxID=382258 RepID=UPI0025DCDF02|nr:Hsp20/alpha crystallin family protein [uncultured Agrococcus sp.]